MALVIVRRIFDDRRSVVIAPDGAPSAKEVRTYLVEFDDVANTAGQAQVANDGTTAVPSIYSTSGDVRLRTIDVARDQENPTFWTVTTNWESDASSVSRSAGEIWNVTVEVDGWEYEQEVENDVVDVTKAIDNSAGVPYDPKLVESYADEQITITWRTMEIDELSMNDARKKTNSDTVNIDVDSFTRMYNPGELWCQKASARSVIAAGVFQYWEVTLVFVFREGGWKRKLLDMGLQELNDDGKLVAINDARGDAITTPVKLDGHGKRLEAGQDCELREFATKTQAAFTPLLIGLNRVRNTGFTGLEVPDL